MTTIVYPDRAGEQVFEVREMIGREERGIELFTTESVAKEYADYLSALFDDRNYKVVPLRISVAIVRAVRERGLGMMDESRSGRFLAAEILRAGKNAGRTDREVEAALCAAFTQVADLPPERWRSTFPKGLTGPFLRRGGTNNVFDEALWFFAAIDAAGLDTAALTPGQIAYRVHGNPPEEIVYIRREAEAKRIRASTKIPGADGLTQ